MAIFSSSLQIVRYKLEDRDVAVFNFFMVLGEDNCFSESKAFQVDRDLCPMVARTAGVQPWTVDCSLHPWLEGRRPFLGTVMAISTDGASVSIARETHVAKAGASVKRHWDTMDGSEKRKGHPVDLYGWTGAGLEGVWDVVESTLSESSPDVLRELLESSGAEVVMGGGGGGGNAGRGRSGLMQSML